MLGPYFVNEGGVWKVRNVGIFKKLYAKTIPAKQASS